MSNKPNTTAETQQKLNERNERLAEQLRTNLRRRKEQGRARTPEVKKPDGD
ncbi:MAG: hypothetical protein KAI28_11390 [Sphingomonadales bacterium]|nr:hypothetical protein [Sphingomonadales bacterium]